MSSAITNIMLSSLQPTSSSPHLLPKISRAPRNAGRRRASTLKTQRRRTIAADHAGPEERAAGAGRRAVRRGSRAGRPRAAGRREPLAPPDLSKCGIANSSEIFYQCCPPYGPNPPKPDDIPFYQIPKTEKTRVRMPAHKMTAEQLSKFKQAIRKMKELPETDPRNFFQQAQVHCAYYNEAYDQVGYDQNTDREKNIALQVHFSWIFLPWHRWYLYFYEKILGSLIGDDSFALPYWNYDHADGMRFPSIYTDYTSPLFDHIRNFDNCDPKAPKLVDLAGTKAATEEQQIKDNLAYIKTVFDENKGLPEAFIGDSVVAGEKNEESTGPLSSGQLENLHNVVHVWTGSSAKPNFNMGNFVSAARDPVFYGHHANVDRLWEIYRKKVMKPPIESASADWLDSTFIFFDENQKNRRSSKSM
ncbi:hypothetical protein ACLOJK_007303 [Asimina triloba]